MSDFSETPEEEPEAIEEMVAPDADLEADVVSPEELLDEQAEVAADEEDEEETYVRPESPYDRPGQWFVIHSYSGYEKKVKSNLESRIAS